MSRTVKTALPSTGAAERLVERAAVRQARQRVDAGHAVLVALGVHQAALEELDRRDQARVRDPVGQRPGAAAARAVRPR